MAFTTGRQTAVPNRGTDSYVILWEQNGWDVADANGDFPTYEARATIDSADDDAAYIYQPQVTNIGIVRQGTTIDSSYFKGSPIHSREGDGPGNVGGDLTFNVSGNGTPQILRWMLQSENPPVTRLGTYTETSVLGSTTAIGTTTTNIQSANNLSDVPVPIPVKVTMSGSPVVDSGAADGHITVGGKDRNGNTVNWSATFTTAEIAAGTLTKTSPIHFSEVDDAQPGDFTAGNYQIDADKPNVYAVVDDQPLRQTRRTTTDDLETGSGSFGDTGRTDITPMPVYVMPTSATIASGALRGYIYVTGTDVNGNGITDVIVYQNQAADLTRTKRSAAYFRTITNVSSEGFGSGATYSMDAVNEAANVTFDPSTEPISYCTIETGKTTSPSTYRNVIPMSTSINFSRAEPVRVVMTVTGGEPELGVNATTRATTPTDRSRLLYTSDDVFSGWQCQILAGNLEFRVASATLTINHNIVPADILGSQYPTSPPTFDDERDVMVTLELESTAENDFRDLFGDNIPLRDIAVRITNVAKGAYPHRLEFQFPVTQIMEDPDYVIEDFGIVGQTLTLRSVFEVGLPYEIRTIANYSNYYPVKDYS